jgi:hypothetical protein
MMFAVATGHVKCLRGLCPNGCLAPADSLFAPQHKFIASQAKFVKVQYAYAQQHPISDNTRPTDRRQHNQRESILLLRHYILLNENR